MRTCRCLRRLARLLRWQVFVYIELVDRDVECTAQYRKIRDGELCLDGALIHFHCQVRIGRLFLKIGAAAPRQLGSQAVDTGRIAVELDHQPGHREHLILQISHQRAADLQFDIDLRRIRLDRPGEIELRRDSGCHAAGFQAEIRNDILGTGGLVFPDQCGLANVHAIDFEFDRR